MTVYHPLRALSPCTEAEASPSWTENPSDGGRSFRSLFFLLQLTCNRFHSVSFLCRFLLSVMGIQLCHGGPVADLTRNQRFASPSCHW